MARVSFTENLRRYIACSTLVVSGDTVRGALEQVFVVSPTLRSYLLDDQGRLRRHVTVFVDARLVADREGLTDAVRADSEIFVVQALSGG